MITRNSEVSIEKTRKYLQSWLDEIVTLEIWKIMESVDALAIIEEELVKKCEHELEGYRNNAIIEKTQATFNLDFSKYINQIEELFGSDRGNFEKECEFVEYKHYFLRYFVMASLEGTQRVLFKKYVKQKTNEWIRFFQKSSSRKTLAIRETKLFQDLLAGTIDDLQAEVLNRHFGIDNWKRICSTYEISLRAKFPRNSTNIHHAENIVLAQVVPNYIEYLQGWLEKHEFDAGKSNSKFSNTLSDALPKVPIQFSESEAPGIVPTPNKKPSKTTKLIVKLQWKEKIALIADKQLDKLYASLINPTGWNTSFIDCSREVFKEVMKSNGKMKITWTSEQIHLLWFIQSLQNRRDLDLINKPFPYYEGLIQSFAPTNGSFSVDGLKDSNQRLRHRTNIDRAPYSTLTAIIDSLTLL